MSSGSKNKKTAAKGASKVRSYANSEYFIRQAEASKEVMRKYPLPKELATAMK